MENRLRFRIHGALQDLECNKYNVPQFVTDDDGTKVEDNESIAITQDTPDGSIVNTKTSVVEIKRFKETSV